MRIMNKQNDGKHLTSDGVISEEAVAFLAKVFPRLLAKVLSDSYANGLRPGFLLPGDSEQFKFTVRHGFELNTLINDHGIDPEEAVAVLAKVSHRNFAGALSDSYTKGLRPEHLLALGDPEQFTFRHEFALKALINNHGVTPEEAVAAVAKVSHGRFALVLSDSYTKGLRPEHLLALGDPEQFTFRHESALKALLNDHGVKPQALVFFMQNNNPDNLCSLVDDNEKLAELSREYERFITNKSEQESQVIYRSSHCRSILFNQQKHDQQWGLIVVPNSTT